MLCKRPISRLLLLASFALASLAFIPRASAYAWMIRHGYTGCATCHVDPSGADLLTPYGSEQGSLQLATRWSSSANDEVAARRGELLFGALTMPDWLRVGGQLRDMVLVTSVNDQTDSRFILMQSDLAAAVHVSRIHAEVSAGVARDGAFGAAVFGDDEGMSRKRRGPRAVSRIHWIGLDLTEDQSWLLRAGRLVLPFGVRGLEHDAWVRAATRTDINAAQQHGISLAYTGDAWRGEAMLIAGNFQIRPDAYRERGYSAYVERAFSERIAIGGSSLVTHAKADLMLQTALWRQAHGLLVRASPAPWLALLGEADFLAFAKPRQRSYGVAGWAQADVEPLQGLHFIGTLESRNLDIGRTGLSLSGGLAVAWFFFPHADVRIDGALQSLAVPGARITAEAFLVQGHFYL